MRFRYYINWTRLVFTCVLPVLLLVLLNGKIFRAIRLVSDKAILYPYTAERRDVLGCTSLMTKRFPKAWEMSRGGSPRDISRAEGNLEVGGDVQPNISRLEAVYGHSLIINPYQGMYQEIHPFRAGSIGRVKINTSLLMMREWHILIIWWGLWISAYRPTHWYDHMTGSD